MKTFISNSQHALFAINLTIDSIKLWLHCIDLFSKIKTYYCTFSLLSSGFMVTKIFLGTPSIAGSMDQKLTYLYLSAPCGFNNLMVPSFPQISLDLVPFSILWPLKGTKGKKDLLRLTSLIPCLFWKRTNGSLGNNTV